MSRIDVSRGSTRLTRALVVTACCVIIVAGMKASAELLVPFLLSVFLAVICGPPLAWLQRRGVGRGPAIAVVVLGALALGAGVMGVVLGSLRSFEANLPEYEARITAQAEEVVAWAAAELEAHDIHVDRKRVLSIVDPGAVMLQAGSLLSGLGEMLGNAFFILLIVILLLAEASGLQAKLQAASDDPRASFDAVRQFTGNVNQYMAIKTWVSVATGIAAAAWLAVLGVDYPVLWGLLTFLFNYVPNLGSILAAIPPSLLALVQLGPGSAGLVALGYLVVNLVMGNVVEPRFMGRGLGLSTLVVFLSLLFWNWVLGPVGMLLSIPLTMTVKIGLESNEGTRSVAVLLGSVTRAGHEAGAMVGTGGVVQAPGSDITGTSAPDEEAEADPGESDADGGRRDPPAAGGD